MTHAKILIVICVLMILLITPRLYPHTIEAIGGEYIGGSSTGYVHELDYWDDNDDPRTVACGISCRTNAGYFERNITAGARLKYDGEEVQICINKNKPDEYCKKWGSGRHDVTQDTPGTPSGRLSIENDDGSRHRYTITFSKDANKITATYHHTIGCMGLHIDYHAMGDDFNPERSYAYCKAMVGNTVIAQKKEGSLG